MMIKLCLVLGVMLVAVAALGGFHPNDCKFSCEPSPFNLCAKNRGGRYMSFASSCHMDKFNCLYMQDYSMVGKGECVGGV